MKVLVAPDSFKDCLTALETAKNIAEGIKAAIPGADIKIVPMADGGEGTVQSLVDATTGRIINITVHDPLMRKTPSFYGILGDGKTAVIEMAAASGLEKLLNHERNPWHTTTLGTGELMVDALNQGCRHIIVGIGGSATNDGGAGMAHALGYRFYDKNNKALLPTGGNLKDIAKIDNHQVHPSLKNTTIEVACDVNNPFTGPNGAAMVYSFQKGADEAMAKELDNNLVFLANLIRKQFNQNIENVPGSGAAGGLGGGLMAFAGATLKKGFDLVAAHTQLEYQIKLADIVVTGEGKMDAQTQYGKTPYGVAQMAKKYNKPVIGIAGTLGKGYEELYQCGFNGLFSIIDKPSTLEYAIENAPELLKNAGFGIFNVFKL